MLKQLFTIFEIDGEEYIADERFLLTSNPPQYSCYSLKDTKHIYKFCHDIHALHKRYATDEEARKYLKGLNYV